MKIAIRRWFIALAVRIPGHADPACIGIGLPRYEDEARRVAMRLAEEIAS